MRGIRAALERRGEAIEPGDVYIHNDAYGGASHVPDVAFCVPVFYEGALVGFAGTAAHHVDIGAHTPGSAGIVDAVDAYAEGIQLKGLKIYDKGVKNTTLWRCWQTISVRPIWCWATWRRRSRLPGSAPRPFSA